MPKAERMMSAMPFDLLDDIAGRSQGHQRMEEAKGREVHAGMTQHGLFLSDRPQVVIPAAEAAAAQSLRAAAVELFDQRTAPTGGQARHGADRRRRTGAPRSG